MRDAGFGREVRGVLAARRQWLIEQGLADGDGVRVRLRVGALIALQRRELLRVAGDLARALGKPLRDLVPGERIEGHVVRRLDLKSGRYALIENSREFSLVPWREALSRRIGQQVSGIMRVDGINGQFGRGRGGPEIS